jgi:hypothetical protein
VAIQINFVTHQPSTIQMHRRLEFFRPSFLDNSFIIPKQSNLRKCFKFMNFPSSPQLCTFRTIAPSFLVPNPCNHGSRPNARPLGATRIFGLQKVLRHTQLSPRVSITEFTKSNGSMVHVYSSSKGLKSTAIFSSSKFSGFRDS